MVVDRGTSPFGLSGGFDFPQDQFSGQVEKYWAERAALFDARADWDGLGEAVIGFDVGGSVRIGVADEVNQRFRDAHMCQCGKDRRVGDASERVAKIEPGEVEVFLISACISY